MDSDAINKAIDAAAAAGGGIVDLPAGRYLSFSIRLKSHVTLRFSPGAVLVAGDPASGLGQYDLPEPNAADRYQDFGHSHWRNSLISAIDVEDVAIVGPGLIDGRGLTQRRSGRALVARARRRSAVEHGRRRRAGLAIPRRSRRGGWTGKATRPLP